MSTAYVVATLLAAALTGFSAASVFFRAKWVVRPMADYSVPPFLVDLARYGKGRRGRGSAGRPFRTGRRCPAPVLVSSRIQLSQVVLPKRRCSHCVLGCRRSWS
ncbi:hypothetical protein ACWD0Y_25130, partial [Streptomyces altiplanensis]